MGFSLRPDGQYKFFSAYTNFRYSKMYVYTRDMSARQFCLAEKPFKIHVSAINKVPENNLTHFVVTCLSKTDLPVSGVSNVS